MLQCGGGGVPMFTQLILVHDISTQVVFKMIAHMTEMKYYRKLNNQAEAALMVIQHKWPHHQAVVK